MRRGDLRLSDFVLSPVGVGRVGRVGRVASSDAVCKRCNQKSTVFFEVSAGQIGLTLLWTVSGEGGRWKAEGRRQEAEGRTAGVPCLHGLLNFAVLSYAAGGRVVECLSGYSVNA